MRSILATVFLAAIAAAQSTDFTVPGAAVTASNTNVPLSAGIGRYQQWYAASDLTAALGQPMRFERLQFLAGSGATANATTIDCEVAIGLGYGFGVTGAFDSNFAAPKQIVFPRGNLPLSAGAAGSPVVTVNFTQFFTWDGSSPLVVELRIYGNGRGNTTFAYDFRGTAQGIGKVSRVYQGGNANATSGVAQAGQGLFTSFRARPGVTIPYGSGCPGFNYVTPVASVSGIPEPGAVWTHQVTQASPQRLAMLCIGDSRTQWNGTPLPLDLTPFISAGGCYLQASPLFNLFTVTVGSPGNGLGSIAIPLPPVTGYIGQSFYSQWFVDDPAAVNFTMSSTGGIWSIVKAVGT